MHEENTTRARQSARQLADVIPLRPLGRGLTAVMLPLAVVAQALDHRVRVRPGIAGLRDLDSIVTELVLRGLDAAAGSHESA